MLKDWVPPVVWNLAKKRLGKLPYCKEYESFEQALADTIGYDDLSAFDHLLKTSQSLGSRVQPYATILHLLSIAKQRSISVVDFGGGLGTTYLTCLPYFETGLKAWTIVEQKHYVDYGNEHLKDNILSFNDDLSQSLSTRPDVLLASCVLPYLPNPFETLSCFFKSKVPKIIIDRTPLVDTATVIVKQVVDEKTSYPKWIFNKEDILNCATQDYKLIDSYQSQDGKVESGQGIIDYRGLVFELVEQA